MSTNRNEAPDIQKSAVTAAEDERRRQELNQKLLSLIADGLLFSQCTNAFGGNVEDDWYVQQAKREFHDEGFIEIDDRAVVSISESEGDGAYVMGWLWVEKPGLVPGT